MININCGIRFPDPQNLTISLLDMSEPLFNIIRVQKTSIILSNYLYSRLLYDLRV